MEDFSFIFKIFKQKETYSKEVKDLNEDLNRYSKYVDDKAPLFYC
jgi:hypothetical protein